MACPSCGGSDRDLIAPGFYRCASMVEVRTGGPGLTDPTKGPQVLVSYVVCSHQYQEGSATGLACTCGTFAIGRCAVCGSPVCGDHSRLSERQRLCTRCWNAADAERQRQEHERSQVTQQAYQAERDAWHAETLKALASADPMERLVRVVARVTHSGDGARPGDTDWGTAEALLGPLGTPQQPSWRMQEVVAWFLSRVQGPPPGTIRMERKTLLGGFKSYQAPAWVLHQGLTGTYIFKDAPERACDVAILPTGKALLGGASAWCEVDPRPGWLRGECNISGYGLRRMAELLSLPGVSPPPHPRAANR